MRKYKKYVIKEISKQGFVDAHGPLLLSDQIDERELERRLLVITVGSATFLKDNIPFKEQGWEEWLVEAKAILLGKRRE